MQRNCTAMMLFSSPRDSQTFLTLGRQLYVHGNGVRAIFEAYNSAHEDCRRRGNNHPYIFIGEYCISAAQCVLMHTVLVYIQYHIVHCRSIEGSRPTDAS